MQLSSRWLRLISSSALVLAHNTASYIILVSKTMASSPWESPQPVGWNLCGNSRECQVYARLLSRVSLTLALLCWMCPYSRESAGNSLVFWTIQSTTKILPNGCHCLRSFSFLYFSFLFFSLYYSGCSPVIRPYYRLVFVLVFFASPSPTVSQSPSLLAPFSQIMV